MTVRDRFDAFRAQFAPSEPRAPKAADPPGVTVTAGMVRGAKLAAWGAYLGLMYFLWFKVLSVSQAQYATMEVSHFLPWSNLTLQLHFPLLIAYLFVVATVPYVAKQIIPLMVSIRFKENPWAKSLAIGITLLVSFVLIAGTATVGGKAVIESERDSAVAVERVGQERAALQARLAAVEKDIQDLTGPAAGNRLTAQAARVGEEQWKVAIQEAQRSGAPLMPQRRAALASAIAGDNLRRRREDLIAQIGSATAVASVSSEVKTARTGPLSSVMTWLDTFWILLLALVMDIVCLLMPFLAHVIERTRERQLAAARGEVFVDKTGAAQTPWADEAHMVEDKRNEPKVAPDPEGAAKEYAEATVARWVDTKRSDAAKKGWRTRRGDDAPVLGQHDLRVARSEPTETSEEAIFGAALGVESGDVATDDFAPELGSPEAAGGPNVGGPAALHDGRVAGGDQTQDGRGDDDEPVATESADALTLADLEAAFLTPDEDRPASDRVVSLPRGEGTVVIQDEEAA